MEQNPLVSVLIPTYNRSKYLMEAIDSVLNQTYPNVEVIVVDDGSTDDTPQVVAGYGDRVVNVRKENGGLSAARNAALPYLKGELVCFLDDDDRWLPEKIEKQVACFLSDPALDVVYTATITFYEGEDRRNDDEFIGESADFHKILNHEFPPIMTFMMRTAVLRELNGFDPKLMVVEDWDFMLKLFARYKARGIRDRLVEIRCHSNNASKKLDTILTTSLKVLKDNENWHDDCAECRRISNNVRGWLRERLFNVRRDQALDAFHARAWGAGTKQYIRAVGALTVPEQAYWLVSKILPVAWRRKRGSIHGEGNGSYS